MLGSTPQVLVPLPADGSPSCVPIKAPALRCKGVAIEFVTNDNERLLQDSQRFYNMASVALRNWPALTGGRSDSRASDRAAERAWPSPAPPPNPRRRRRQPNLAAHAAAGGSAVAGGAAQLKPDLLQAVSRCNNPRPGAT
jgi:hypothetical protein